MFLVIGIILATGCQKSENNQDNSLVIEQNENELGENNKESTVQFEELEKTLENNIAQIEVYVNSSTAKGTSFILDTTESIKEIKNLLFKDKDYEAVPAVLCKNHGPFTWGKDAHEAVHNAVVLEEVAKMACRCELINPQVKPAPQELQDKHYYRKHGANAYYGQIKK